MNTQKGIWFFLMVLTATAVLVTSAVAEDDLSGKLTRGALNTTTGWVELPYQVTTQTSKDPYQGLTYGFIDGLSNGVQRTLYGAWDLVTFPFPPHDTPKMDPETLI